MMQAITWLGMASQSNTAGNVLIQNNIQNSHHRNWSVCCSDRSLDVVSTDLFVPKTYPQNQQNTESATLSAWVNTVQLEALCSLTTPQLCPLWLNKLGWPKVTSD